ncbi:hypothetical protein [Heyndrickxia vini]|uniref:Uncharacterized protein n=1 Tax=Heyndrickxia vini TaxID=1476025 RepID=A0ABX7E7K6_9BACI|nr:hypothetical protein [Heyndrickxia vini]QQZ11245.1 hypothetical protein I5776_10310 [Heyndrickxia vini]
MKKEYVLAIFAFFFMSLSTVAISYAGESAKTNEKIIHEYKVDVTGDRKPDKIILKGIQVDVSSMYMKKIWTEITSSNNKKFRIEYEPGYKPKIEFADLNHDNVLDLLESSGTGGSGGIYNYRLTTLKDSKMIDIPMPPPLNVQGHFENYYKAHLTIPNINFTKNFNLSGRKKDYIRLGLFQENGMLNEPTELMIDPVAMYKIVKVKEKEGFGLISYRRVSGAYHADALGTIISVWYFENGKWKLIQTKWKDW